MSLTVNTNMASLVAQRSLFGASKGLDTSMQRLSTGLRINTAADDAAGLGLAEKLKGQVSASDIAKANAQTGINMIQTAEADLSIIQENLQRMRDLATQASNGVYSTNERNMISAEYGNLGVEIDRIAKSSTFSEIKLLSGFTAVDLQVGTNNTADDRINLPVTLFKTFTGTTNGMPGTSATLASAAAAQTAITSMATAISTISTTRAGMGAMINRLQGTITRIDTRKENMLSSLSVIMDADVAKEAAEMTKGQILKQTAVSMLQQAGQQPQLALSLLR